MLNPLMLLGLLGLSVPVIIHLIQRQRLRPQPLATLQFLDKEDVANAFAPRPRDLLQLLLRLLLLALFVLLMSRLAFSGGEPGPRTHTIILDQSMSMQRQVGAGSHFDQARRQVEELIAGMRPQDTMAILLVGDRVTADSGFLRDPEALRDFVEAARVSGSGGQALLPTIREAVTQARTRRDPNATVLVFSDYQRNTFDGYLNEAPEAADLRDQLAAGGVELLFVGEPLPAPPNVSVMEARFTPPATYLGAGSRLTSVVRNDQEEAATVTLQFYEGTSAAANRQIEVQPDETVHIDLVHRFESPVDSATRVEVSDDALPGDNAYHLPMRMKSRQQVLLVAQPTDDADEETARIGTSGLQLLTYALNPGEALGMGTDTYVNVRRIAPAFLERVSLPMYSVIVLYDVTSLTDQTVVDLLGFVRNGGGLYIVPGTGVSPLRFNDVYSPLLGNLQIGQAREPADVMGLNESEAGLTEPLLLPLLHGSWGPVEDLHLSRYLSVEAEGQARAALLAANGDWLAATARLGSGRVFLQLFSSGLEDSTFPRSVAFVPMVQEIVNWVGQADVQQPVETMRVGDLLRLPTPSFRGLSGEAMAIGPVTQTFPLGGQEGEEVLIEGLLQPGAYQLVHPAKQTGRKRWFTVNPVTEEADVTPLGDEAFAALFGGEHVTIMPFDEVAGSFTSRRELAGLLVVLVLLALIIEALAGAWQSRTGYRARKLREKAQ